MDEQKRNVELNGYIFVKAKRDKINEEEVSYKSQ